MTNCYKHTSTLSFHSKFSPFHTKLSLPTPYHSSPIDAHVEPFWPFFICTVYGGAEKNHAI